MRKDDDASIRSHPRAMLDAHGVYLSDSDEVEITRRLVEADDVGLLALRTCLCGARIDGFDEYWNHLREVFSRPS